MEFPVFGKNVIVERVASNRRSKCEALTTESTKYARLSTMHRQCIDIKPVPRKNLRDLLYA